MIDLRFRELPHSIESDGITYELDTDFRTWIAFEHDMLHNGFAPNYIFKGDLPLTANALDAVMEFYESPNETPSKGEPSDARALDLVSDGDYVVAAFQQAYGIDLTSVEYMHWHRFKALLNGLPEDTMLARIITYRTWKKRPENEKHDDVMAKQKRRWQLPPLNKEERENQLDDWARSLGL